MLKGMPKTDSYKEKSSSGFTLIELMLASAVFALVLLIALNGFLQIGRLFYKGVSNTETQATARQIIDDLSGNIQVASEVSSQQSANGYYYYCLGNYRYTYTRTAAGEAVMVDLSQSRDYSAGNVDGNFGLLKDALSGSNACAAPCDSDMSVACPTGGIRFNKPIELLGNKQRLAELQITPHPSIADLYDVRLKVVYGDDSSLEFNPDASNPASAQCKGGLSNQQFCATSQLNTSVFKSSPGGTTGSLRPLAQIMSNRGLSAAKGKYYYEQLA